MKFARLKVCLLFVGKSTFIEMRKMKIVSLLITLFLFGIVMSGCKTVINNLAFHPDNVNVIQQNSLPQGIEEFVVLTEDDVKITNLYLPAADSDKILIYFHGNAGNIYHRIPDLMQLQKSGLNVVGVSYRGYGKSEGAPSEDGIYQDGKAIFRYVSKELGFSDKNIVIFGRSIGTTVAINTAQYKEIAGLVLVSPLTSGKAQAKASGLGLFSSLAGNSFDNIAKIKNILAPVLVIHGTKDRIVPHSMGKEIFDAVKSRKKLIKIKGAGHNDIHDVYRQEYWSTIFSFLKNILS